jgi:hypothetical protein
MAEPKTRPTDVDPKVFLNSGAPEKFRGDSFILLELLADITQEPAVMWGPAIVGYGSYLPPQKGVSTWPIIAFSPRKNDLTVYIMAGTRARPDLIEKLGPHRVGSSCLYLKSLDKIDMDVLRELMTWSVAHMREKYNTLTTP